MHNNDTYAKGMMEASYTVAKNYTILIEEEIGSRKLLLGFLQTLIETGIKNRTGYLKGISKNGVLTPKPNSIFSTIDLSGVTDPFKTRVPTVSSVITDNILKKVNNETKYFTDVIAPEVKKYIDKVNELNLQIKQKNAPKFSLIDVSDKTLFAIMNDKGYLVEEISSTNERLIIDGVIEYGEIFDYLTKSPFGDINTLVGDMLGTTKDSNSLIGKNIVLERVRSTLLVNNYEVGMDKIQKLSPNDINTLAFLVIAIKNFLLEKSGSLDKISLISYNYLLTVAIRRFKVAHHRNEIYKNSIVLGAEKTNGLEFIIYYNPLVLKDTKEDNKDLTLETVYGAVIKSLVIDEDTILSPNKINFKEDGSRYLDYYKKFMKFKGIEGDKSGSRDMINSYVAATSVIDKRVLENAPENYRERIGNMSNIPLGKLSDSYYMALGIFSNVICCQTNLGGFYMYGKEANSVLGKDAESGDIKSYIITSLVMDYLAGQFV